MNVFVVTRWDWGGGGDDDRIVLGVFSTRELANAYVTTCTVPPRTGYAPVAPDVSEFVLDAKP